MHMTMTMIRIIGARRRPGEGMQQTQSIKHSLLHMEARE